MNWLDELKVGDKVIVSNGVDGDIAKVERLTKTLVIVAYDSGAKGKFSKRDGSRVPYSFSYKPNKICEWSKEGELKLIENKKIEINGYRFADLKPTDTEIAVMLNALDEYRSKSNDN